MPSLVFPVMLWYWIHIAGGVRDVRRPHERLAQATAIRVHIAGERIHAEAAADRRFGAEQISEAKPRQPVVPHRLLQREPAMSGGVAVPHRARSIGGGVDHI